MGDKSRFFITTLMTYFFASLLPEAAWTETRSSLTSSFEETFDHLDDWKHFLFPSVNSSAVFEIGTASNRKNGETFPAAFLHMSSNSGASALVYASRLSLTRESALRWKWLVKVAPQTTDPTKRSGDDYAVRVYIMASETKPAASVWTRMRLALAEKFADERPGPTLAYVWTAATPPPRCSPSPYTNLVRIISIQGDLGSWASVNVQPERDFYECFGVSLAGPVRLALMTDSDNSGSSTDAYLSELHLVEAAE